MVPSSDNCWPIFFSPISDPPVFNVLYLVKYPSDFINFTSHAIKMQLKIVATLENISVRYIIFWKRNTQYLETGT